jgi:diketogulonate reductase-like aldo/keto reductase
VPFEEVLEGLGTLRDEGKIRHYGVSNVDVDEMSELLDLPGGEACAVNQVLYSLARREIESGLMDLCLSHGIGVMAYTPLDSGRLAASEVVRKVAKRHETSAARVALAWVLRQEGMIAIPKAGRVEHVEDNAGALDVHLDEEDLAELDREFPPPRGYTPLEMI